MAMGMGLAFKDVNPREFYEMSKDAKQRANAAFQAYDKSSSSESKTEMDEGDPTLGEAVNSGMGGYIAAQGLNMAASEAAAATAAAETAAATTATTAAAGEAAAAGGTAAAAGETAAGASVINPYLAAAIMVFATLFR